MWIYLYLKVKFDVKILSHIPALSAVEVLKHFKIFSPFVCAFRPA